jgi:prepilin-type N-terminal cleavage/methylation domain-containing protein
MKQQGFTLVEIALVIVILGLLVGGFLKGREFIKQAQIKNLESTFESVAKAIYTYQERYQALPGDDTGAKRFAGDPTINGINIIVPDEKNGKIAGKFDTRDNNEESRLAWLHLRCARFIPKTFVETMQEAETEWQEQPRNVFNGIIGVSNDLDLNNNNGLEDEEKGLKLFIGFTNIPGDVAEILDSTQDDGLAASGRVISNQDNNPSKTLSYEDKTSFYKVYFYL